MRKLKLDTPDLRFTTIRHGFRKQMNIKNAPGSFLITFLCCAWARVLSARWSKKVTEGALHRFVLPWNSNGIISSRDNILFLPFFFSPAAGLKNLGGVRERHSKITQGASGGVRGEFLGDAPDAP